MGPPISERQDSWNRRPRVMEKNHHCTALDDEQRSRSGVTQVRSPLDLEEIEMPTNHVRSHARAFTCGFGFPDSPQSGVKRRVSRLGNLPHSLLKTHKGRVLSRC